MLGEFTEKLQLEYNENFKRVRLWIYVCWVTCLIALVIPFICVVDLKEQALIFQRAGSMLVALAVLSDIQIRSFSRFTKVRAAGVDYINMDNQYRTVWFDKVTAVIAVLGTFIWGYGDILVVKAFECYEVMSK